MQVAALRPNPPGAAHPAVVKHLVVDSKQNLSEDGSADASGQQAICVYLCPMVDHDDSLTLPYASILDAITDGVFTVDLEWRITSFNRAAESLLGYRREEALGQLCSQICQACDGLQNCSLRRSVESQQPLVNQREEMRHRDGQRIPVHSSTNILIDSAGRCHGGVKTFRDRRPEETLRRIAHATPPSATLIGASAAMQKVITLLPTIASSAVTVLISGESGSGKEVVARALHHYSPRHDQPFVAINCGALPDSLLESELFGYVAGAFTDARKDKPGRFALAHGGTLFLDEIGDVSPAMQVRLLRVLQERCYEPLGSTTSIPCDVRIIAASNRNLPAEVAAERFRRDLYYRLAVIPIHLPPLRERDDDVLRLAQYFVQRLAERDGQHAPDLSPEVCARLQTHQWPGNVRELANALERAWVLGKGQIHAQHLPGSGLTGTYYNNQNNPTKKPATGPARTLSEQRVSAEAALIMSALRDHDWNRLATAKTLGMHKTTLFRKIRQLGLKPPRQGEADSP